MNLELDWLLSELWFKHTWCSLLANMSACPDIKKSKSDVQIDIPPGWSVNITAMSVLDQLQQHEHLKAKATDLLRWIQSAHPGLPHDKQWRPEYLHFG